MDSGQFIVHIVLQVGLLNLLRGSPDVFSEAKMVKIALAFGAQPRTQLWELTSFLQTPELD